MKNHKFPNRLAEKSRTSSTHKFDYHIYTSVRLLLPSASSNLPVRLARVKMNIIFLPCSMPRYAQLSVHFYACLARPI